MKLVDLFFFFFIWTLRHLLTSWQVFWRPLGAQFFQKEILFLRRKEGHVNQVFFSGKKPHHILDTLNKKTTQGGAFFAKYFWLNRRIQLWNNDSSSQCLEKYQQQILMEKNNQTWASYSSFWWTNVSQLQNNSTTLPYILSLLQIHKMALPKLCISNFLTRLLLSLLLNTFSKKKQAAISKKILQIHLKIEKKSVSANNRIIPLKHKLHDEIW